MLTYRTGAAGTPSVAKAMSEHLGTMTDVPELQAKLSIYYGNGLESAQIDRTAGVPREDMNPAVANLLGIDPRKALDEKQVTHLLTGLRADGEAIPGKQIQRGTKDRTRIGYIDLTFSAPKSFSVALAFAPTEAERAILDRAHREAVNSIMTHIAGTIGVARKGKGGRQGWEDGHIAWVQFDHFTARPTIKMPVTENGIPTTELLTVRVAGDPQRHTHVIVPNVVVTDAGRVTSIHQQKIKDRIHEWGSLYQAFLATNLRRSGVEVELDSDETKSINQRMARLVSVPRHINEHFSKRTEDGEEAARAYALEHGADWDRLSPEQRAVMLKGGTAKARREKTDDLADYQAWLRQAEDVGYQHRSVLRPDARMPLAPTAERIAAAYEASLPVLEPELQRRSTFEGSLARVAAAKGLIAAGIERADEIDLITRAYRTEGVRQDGLQVPLLWGKSTGHTFHSFTTQLHIDQEEEAIRLLSAAAADRSAALPRRLVRAAVRKVATEGGLDFTTEHGRRQLGMVYKLAAGGRAVVGIGIAGSGKSTVIRPLAEAWHAAGRRTIGATLAWRQAEALGEAGVGKRRRRASRVEPDPTRLVEAGIEKRDTYALAALIQGLQKGGIQADRNTVVVVDEIAQVGTRQILQLARLQAQHGFQIVGVGDDLQCQAIEAGASINLFRRALGNEQVPELLETVRQETERDRVTSLMFRDGRSQEALERKDEDGTLRIVPGGYRQAVEAAVDLLEERIGHWRGEPIVAISVPTNADARAVGAEIRRRRQGRGEIAPDQAVLDAIDQTGTEYTLPVAAGDRLRLFKRIYYPEGGAFAFNGSVVDVLAVDSHGLTLRNKSGREALIAWTELRDDRSDRIMLTYGDALTIDARQGDTVTEHITVLPAGSKAINGYKAYTTESRHRVRSYVVTSQGEEMAEIERLRPLGDPRNLDREPTHLRAAIIANMARNMDRKPEKILATDFVARAAQVRAGAVRSMQAAWHRAETGHPPKPRQAAARKQEAKMIAATTAMLPEKAAAIERLMNAIRDPILVRPPTQAAPAPRTARAAPAPRPKISLAEAQAQFAAQLESIGLRLPGAPIMDGQRHPVPVEGNRGKRKSGFYRSRADGAGGYGLNSKTGQEVRWTAVADGTETSRAAAVSGQDQAARAAAAQARARSQQALEAAGAAQAQRLWDGAKPAYPDHPYLVRKGVWGDGLRMGAKGQTATFEVDGETRKVKIAGRLLIPMRDIDGKLWNVQMIRPDGDKLFLSGRKKGLFAVIGGKTPEAQPIVIAEGYATAATLRATTSLTSLVAFDAGNLVEVAMQVRRAQPDRPIIVAGDNDHHAPRRTPPLANVGAEKALAAATAVGGIVAIPPFKPEDKGTDWNDHAAQHGAAHTRDELLRQLDGIALPPPAPAIDQAERDASRAGLQAAEARKVAPRPPTQEERREYKQ